MEVREFVKGYKRMCDNSKDCDGCPLDDNCYSIENLTEEEIIKVEKWIEEHPIMTNRMKFKEVFGVEPVAGGKLLCSPNEYKYCDGTCFECSQWWDSEYIEPKGK